MIAVDVNYSNAVRPKKSVRFDLRVKVKFIGTGDYQFDEILGPYTDLHIRKLVRARQNRSQREPLTIARTNTFVSANQG